MSNDFGLFVQDGKGPLFRVSVPELVEAKRRAQELARTEGLECFVYCFKTFTKVARFHPPRNKSTSPSPKQGAPPG